ncbi:MAG: M28 family peptidase [Phycisphaerae bacterium]|nr:M28 family peptidase [Phycisphaerae bacterium]
MSSRRLVGLLVALVFVLPVALRAESLDSPKTPASTQPVSERMYQRSVTDLASEAMEGRAVGSKGGEVARDYIVDQFRQAGLLPAFGSSYLQEFPANITTRRPATTAPTQPDSRVTGKVTTAPARPTTAPTQPDRFITETKKVMVHNVVGIIPGRGSLAGEAIIIGGHYDALGTTGKKTPAGKLIYHPGADDNASGTSGVMLLAHWFVAKEKTLGSTDCRTIIFATFTGEERGLWGSNFMAGHLPPIPSATQPDTTVPPRVIAMLNLDMISRLRNNVINVQGTESGEHWKEVIESAAAKVGKLDIRMGGGGIGPSDHASFYQRKIPVLFFITGGHGDLHQPSDTADKVNTAGAVQVLRLVEAVADELRSEQPVRVAYLAPKPRPVTTAPAKGAMLGVVPDPSGADGDGCTVVDVLDKGPADKAGIKPDDIIVKWNDKAIAGTRGLLTAVGAAKAGDTVKLQIRRDGKVLDIPVTLGPR